MLGTSLCAFTAAYACTVIYNGMSVLHCNRILFAGFCTQPAADTPNRAYGLYCLALLL